MLANGYTAEFAERCFKQIEGFGTYGFPESHAIAFAYLVYVSAWLKCHYPGAFACALLNSQPMGFYAPSQIIRDARDHGVQVLPADARYSDWDSTLENGALRLGLRLVQGLSADAGARIMAARPAASLEELARRAGLDRGSLSQLAEADACRGFGLDRRAALWAAAAFEAPAPLAAEVVEPGAALPRATAGEQTVLDYTSTGLTLRHHPLALLRPRLGPVDTRTLARAPQGKWLRLPGLVLVRQRPGSAKGVVFFTVEDEWGTANLVLYPHVAQEFRAVVVTARLVIAEGRVERHQAAIPIIHLLVRKLHDASDLLASLHATEADPLLRSLARADEVNRPVLRSEPGVRLNLPPSRDFH